MATDDLSAPLGQEIKTKRFPIPVSPATLIGGVLGAVVVMFFGWIVVAKDPLGGEPTAAVTLDTQSGAPQSQKPETIARQDQPGAPVKVETPRQQTVTIVDGSTGQKQEVVIGNGGSETPRSIGGDPRLLEASRHGMIPKIGTDGARPSEVYARPAKQIAADVPRIAIVIDGLGIGANATSEAITKLPGAVTLAFTPYGTDVEKMVARAREAGHEILLQVPMEPFDYPDNDAGPQTLLTSLSNEQNIDRLYWIMSRFQGYVGMTNYMGARFIATEAAITPIVKEAAKRGLLYIDDGVQPRSFAGQIATAAIMPFARTDVVLDTLPTANDITKALSKLEATARSNGVAVGVASALPASVAKLAQWAKTIEARGFALVPISVAAAKAKQS